MDRLKWFDGYYGKNGTYHIYRKNFGKYMVEYIDNNDKEKDFKQFDFFNKTEAMEYVQKWESGEIQQDFSKHKNGV